MFPRQTSMFRIVKIPPISKINQYTK
uniref:Uncharacterized protein n=1 Tax=Anguilla anguilla TaxID=7936 RepID=A0A0E9TTP6_ANGAN